jgi:D-alanyl-D-alanine carboxypeptidase
MHVTRRVTALHLTQDTAPHELRDTLRRRAGQAASSSVDSVAGVSGRESSTMPGIVGGARRLDADRGRAYRASRMRHRTVPLFVLLALIGVLATGAAAVRAVTPAGTTTLGARLQAIIDEERVDLGAPGISAAMIMPDDTTWRGQSGLADIAARRPVEERTTFAIGSITKTFVAAAIVQLADERRLALEDPISRWLPGWPNGSDITVRMLLDHTSGIYNYFENPSYVSLVFGRPTHRWTTNEILSLVGEPRFAPGTDYGYSNTNYVLLGRIIRRVTGRSPAAEVRARFLGPLRLADEVYQGQEPLAAYPAAKSYLRSGGGWDDQSAGTTMRPEHLGGHGRLGRRRDARLGARHGDLGPGAARRRDPAAGDAGRDADPRRVRDVRPSGRVAGFSAATSASHGGTPARCAAR